MATSDEEIARGLMNEIVGHSCGHWYEDHCDACRARYAKSITAALARVRSEERDAIVTEVERGAAILDDAATNGTWVERAVNRHAARVLRELVPVIRAVGANAGD